MSKQLQRNWEAAFLIRKRADLIVDASLKIGRAPFLCSLAFLTTMHLLTKTFMPFYLDCNTGFSF